MRNITAAFAARRRRSSGFSLVEIAMVLAIIALLVAGIMLFFNNASSSQKTNDAGTEIAAVSQVVRSLWAGQPDYTGVTTSAIAASGQLPNKWTKGTGLTDAFAGAVSVGGTASNTNFFITMTNVPSLACNKFATTDMGTGLIGAFINGTAQSFPLTPAQANGATACGGTAPYSITWVLN
jgi:prepilin-type N-terminal cleavage/methylation domain-containing protein